MDKNDNIFNDEDEVKVKEVTQDGTRILNRAPDPKGRIGEQIDPDPE